MHVERTKSWVSAGAAIQILEYCEAYWPEQMRDADVIAQHWHWRLHEGGKAVLHV